MTTHRYAAFRTSRGYGPEVGEEPPGDAPFPGAVLDGTFYLQSVDEIHHRWVVEIADLDALEDLSRRLGKELVFSTVLSGRYWECYDLLEGPVALDGIVEVIDDYRD